MLKSNNWTNKEVMDILEGCKIYIEEEHLEDPDNEWAKTHNAAISMCINQFYDFDQDPETAHCAMAYDTESKQIFVTSKPLPQ